MSEFESAADIASRWGISPRRVAKLCAEGRIYGAKKIGKTWMVPREAPKPCDGRSMRYKEECRIPEEPLLTSIDLFSGPGGLATGFRWAGIKPLVAVEWSYWTAQTYSKTHNAEILDLAQYIEDESSADALFRPSDRPVLIYGDINGVSVDLVKKLLLSRYGLETVDIVTGGAPCESFSMAGDRKEVDERNQLYQNILRIARGVNSRMFMFENVKGLFSKKMDGKVGAMYRAICDEFEEERDGEPSFRLVSRDKDEVLLKAVDYGVPQARERLFLVGINRECSELEFSYPRRTNGPEADFGYVSVGDAISDLPRLSMGHESATYSFDMAGVDEGSARGMFLRRMRGDLSMPPSHLSFGEASLSAHKAPGHTKKMLSRFGLIRQGENMRSATERLAAEGNFDAIEQFFPKKIYAARNRRLRPEEPSFTVTSHCLDEMVHPTANRGLTPREAARLQSFPDWYVFEGPYVKFHSDPDQDQYEQIGDAIPPLLAYALGKEVVRTLKRN